MSSVHRAELHGRQLFRRFLVVFVTILIAALGAESLLICEVGRGIVYCSARLLSQCILVVVVGQPTDC